MTTETPIKTFVVTPPPIPSVPIAVAKTAPSSLSQDFHFPVHRIYCVGRNYAEHALEMGGDPTREPPFFFCKPASAIVVCDGRADDVDADATDTDPKRSMTQIPYPLATSDLHHEIELVIAIGQDVPTIQGESTHSDIDHEAMMNHVYGFAVGVDLTRRDLQAQAKEGRRPWDSAKAFDQSAPISAIVPQQDWAGAACLFDSGKQNATTSPRIWLTVNDDERQSGVLAQMTWSVPEIMAHLAEQFHLRAGDLIYTGTPAGVGPLRPGDVVRGGVAGLRAPLEFQISEL